MITTVISAERARKILLAAKEPQKDSGFASGTETRKHMSADEIEIVTALWISETTPGTWSFNYVLRNIAKGAAQ